MKLHNPSDTILHEVKDQARYKPGIMPPNGNVDIDLFLSNRHLSLQILSKTMLHLLVNGRVKELSLA